MRNNISIEEGNLQPLKHFGTFKKRIIYSQLKKTNSRNNNGNLIKLSSTQ